MWHNANDYGVEGWGFLLFFGNNPPRRIVSHASDPSSLWYCAERGLFKKTHFISTDYTSSRIDHEERASKESYGACHDVLIFPDNPSHIWMGTDYWLWESTDEGKIWKKLNDDTTELDPVAVMSIYMTLDQEEIVIAT